MMRERGDLSPAEANLHDATPEMIEAGERALLHLVAEDDLTNDPAEIVRQVWGAMLSARGSATDIG